ncbi:mitochondrial ribosomal protein of small subunit [Scheffersomyces xylosifermentans]|uniref:mitochondrial ribosomal protein of small subunit n=1 Tax=Scheffersomyces xylosifermentans TaxID=1304137 RepID=UPI00315D9FF2
MGKGVLKYGGKSGILPKVRPVFKGNPIRTKTAHELEKESHIEQGFAEGVPLPTHTGFTFHRTPPQKKIITVEERIRATIEDKTPRKTPAADLSEEQAWNLQRDEIRREYLKQAYLTEAARLQKIDEIKAEQLEKEKNHSLADEYEDSDAVKLTLPTIDSYLKGPIMRNRTPEEEQLKNQQRILNRKIRELEAQEKKADQLLDLYHAASNFITTEEELEAAITEAFEVNFSKFDGSQNIIEQRLSSAGPSYATVDFNERLITDKVLGEINGKPGLESIKDTLSGEKERLRREAQIVINQERSGESSQ